MWSINRSIQQEVREKMDLSIQIRMAADLVRWRRKVAKTFMARSTSKLVLTNYSTMRGQRRRICA